jgi:hypothetical protein
VAERLRHGFNNSGNALPENGGSIPQFCNAIGAAATGARLPRRDSASDRIMGFGAFHSRQNHHHADDAIDFRDARSRRLLSKRVRYEE